MGIRVILGWGRSLLIFNFQLHLSYEIYTMLCFYDALPMQSPMIVVIFLKNN